MFTFFVVWWSIVCFFTYGLCALAWLFFRCLNCRVEQPTNLDRTVPYTPLPISEQEIAARHQAAVMAAIGEQETAARVYWGDQNGFQTWTALYHDTHNRSITLLKDWLSPDQLASYEAHKNFIVTSSNGNRYRINYGTIGNVDHLNDAGETLASLCFQPTGCQSIGDTMLAQKVMLETDEAAALRVANRMELRHASLYAGLVRATADAIDRQTRRAMSPGPVQNGP